MSSIRWRPRHRVWVPGSPSDLRARKPPSWAMERVIARSEGGCSGGGLRVSKTAQPRQIVDAPGHHGVDRQAGFQAVGGGELAILDLTAALEDRSEERRVGKE